MGHVTAVGSAVGEVMTTFISLIMAAFCAKLVVMKKVDFLFTQEETAQFGKRSVSALILFGSQAQDLAGVGSDFDIGVIVRDKKILTDQTKRDEIYNILYDILSTHIKQLVNVDIVFLETAPAELQAHVMKYGQVLFENRPGIFADFRAKVMEQYADFAPLRAIFHSGIFSQI